MRSRTSSCVLPRYRKLAGAFTGDAKTKNFTKSPILQMEEEKKEHAVKMKKMEAEMEQVFEMKVCSLWSRTTKNSDISAGPLACPFAGTVHSSACSALLGALICSLAVHSRARGKVNDSMTQNDLVLSHCAAVHWTFLSRQKKKTRNICLHSFPFFFFFFSGERKETKAERFRGGSPTKTRTDEEKFGTTGATKLLSSPVDRMTIACRLSVDCL